MMLDKNVVLLMAVALAVARVPAVRRLWKLPLAFGQDRLWGIPVRPEFLQGEGRQLLRGYRTWLVAPLAVEALIVAALWWWSEATYLLFEQVVAAVVVKTIHVFAGVSSVQRVKRLAAEDTWQPVASVALSLTPRRLADYTNVPLETALAMVIVVSLGWIALHLRAPASEPLWPAGERGEALVLPLAMTYVYLGGLLLKHGLVRRRRWLPGERTDEFLQFWEAYLRTLLALCDSVRTVCALMIGIYALHFALGEGITDSVRAVEMLVLIAAAAVWMVAWAKRGKRLQALRKALSPVDQFTRPPHPVDPRFFHLLGWIYFNPDDPSLVVYGPRTLVFNLANWRAYLYAAYLAGLTAVGFVVLTAANA